MVCSLPNFYFFLRMTCSCLPVIIFYFILDIWNWKKLIYECLPFITSFISQCNHNMYFINPESQADLISFEGPNDIFPLSYCIAMQCNIILENISSLKRHSGISGGNLQSCIKILFACNQLGKKQITTAFTSKILILCI